MIYDSKVIVIVNSKLINKYFFFNSILFVKENKF